MICHYSDPSTNAQAIKRGLVFNRDHAMLLRNSVNAEAKIISIDILDATVTAIRFSFKRTAVFRERDPAGIDYHLLLFVTAMNHSGQKIPPASQAIDEPTKQATIEAAIRMRRARKLPSVKRGTR